MAKSNDNIPADEMLLAEAIAAAKARGLKWARSAPFYDHDGDRIGYAEFDKSAIDDLTIGSCCALGALALAGCISIDQAYDGSGSRVSPPRELIGVYDGNDQDRETWPENADEENGESLGWAFRCAMTDGGES